MGIDIKINIDFTTRQKKVVRIAVVTGAVIAALGLGVAFAGIDTTWAQSGQTISATKLRGDLDQLQAQIANGRLVATFDGGVTYSVGATQFKAATSGNYTGPQINGYAGAKAICQSLVGSPSAHMCTGEELVRTTAIGVNVPAGTGGAWYSSGSSSPGGGSPIINDCSGWLEGNSNFQGASWVLNLVNSQNGPSTSSCNTSQPILCCD